MRRAAIAVALLLAATAAPADAQQPQPQQPAPQPQPQPQPAPTEPQPAPTEPQPAPAQPQTAPVEPVAPPPVKPRPFHWAVAAGGSLLFTGLHGGPRNRLDASIDIAPGGRFGRWGMTFALRHVTPDPLWDDGIATAGVTYEPAAARPRLALALHADAGVTFHDRSLAAGGGLQTYLWIWPRRLGPAAVIFDLTAHLVLGNVNDTRLVIASATRLAIAF